MSSEHHQPPHEHPKKLNEITPDEIKDEALLYAVQFGLQARRSDCHIQAVLPDQHLVQEIGGSTNIRLPITKWLVIIPQKGTVTVEYLFGGICATNFQPYKAI